MPRFRKALRAETEGTLDADVVRRALEDGDEALKIALHLYPVAAQSANELLDVAVSWALMALTLGKQSAALVIAEAFRQCVERIDSNPWRHPPDAADLARMRHRLHGWFNIYPLNSVFFEPQRGAGLPRGEFGASSDPSAFSMIPVQAIPSGGRWGKEIALRYDDLTHPIQLKRPLLSPDYLELVLLNESPSFSSAISAICDDLRLQLSGALPISRFRPLLLLGQPGIGKTRFAKRLSRHLGLPMRMISGAGGQTLDVTGLTRVYDSTQPSIVARAMLENRVGNPVILVDEIDKALPEGRERRLQDALLVMIDSETSGSVPDECLATVVDMSNVSWILTANSLQGLSSPLLDRVRIFDVPAPDAEHLPMIVEGIIADIAESYRIPFEELPILPPEMFQELLRMYRSGASIRMVKRAVTASIAVTLRGFPRH